MPADTRFTDGMNNERQSKVNSRCRNKYKGTIDEIYIVVE
jgi:hypothetical protein